MTEKIKENAHKITMGILGLMIPVIMAILVWAFSQSSTLAVHNKQLEYHDEQIKECKTFGSKLEDKIDTIRKDQTTIKGDIREVITLLKNRKNP